MGSTTNLNWIAGFLPSTVQSTSQVFQYMNFWTTSLLFLSQVVNDFFPSSSPWQIPPIRLLSLERQSVGSLVRQHDFLVTSHNAFTSSLVNLRIVVKHLEHYGETFHLEWNWRKKWNIWIMLFKFLPSIEFASVRSFHSHVACTAESPETTAGLYVTRVLKIQSKGYHLKHSIHPIHGWCHKLILMS